MTPASITLYSQNRIVNYSSRSIMNYGSKCNNIGRGGGISSTVCFCQSDVNMANLREHGINRVFEIQPFFPGGGRAMATSVHAPKKNNQS